MTRERIEDMREVVLPFVKKRLLETNYEGLGKSDAKEFEREFNEILNLAIKALEQEPTNSYLADGCIDKWNIVGKKAEAWIIKGKLQIRSRGTIHNIDLPSVTPQEPFKPIVEIDLYSVIKQKYIEREVLDKIRSEIEEIPKKYPMTMDYENGLKEALGIIDKYKTGK